ncbi:MAG TPA: ATP-binding protein [Bacteroidia bacterium]|mgnify:CR=1 FL=1|nr:ATP-binding protein [Bacteroidia bacterium]
MTISPFVYGKIVDNQSFTNREQEVAKLQSNLLQGIHTMIISPRRWGKSSLVEKVLATINLKHKQHKTVLIDLFTVGTEKDFLELFAREVLKASSGKWEERIRLAKDLFKTLVPKISLGADPFTEFSISFDIEELKKNSDEILNLPEKLALKKGIKLIICLDEFQNLAYFPEYELLEKKMRAVWQRHKHVTYCLYGSKRHMMETIFNDSSKPFYKFGDIMVLPKIEKQKWTDFIMESFERTGKKIDPETADRIPKIMKNHSWYVQQLAHYVWNLTKTKATKVEFIRALAEVVTANTPLFQNEIESLSNTQVNILKAVAKNETQLTSSQVMTTYELGTPNNVIKNKKTLADKDLILETENGYEFADPVFELWFRKQYFNTEFAV